MRVPFDHPRDERRTGQVDRRRIRGGSDLRARTDRLDAAAAHEHDPSLVRPRLSPVPHTRGNEQRRRLRRTAPTPSARGAPALREEELRENKGEHEHETTHGQLGVTYRVS